ncbi:MAG TPA: integrase core domain-containing protein [Propionibacteriaceae bacterium]|nr:integrase core domain-containing protein [Propionibacteriaceae bacterium]
MLIFGRCQLEMVLASYVAHYNKHRPHRALGQASPLTAVPLTTPHPADMRVVRVVRVDRLGGLIHEYAQVA